MLPFILTCPASRGVGFELTRRLLKTTRLPIIATARTNLDETHHKLLEGLGDIEDSRLEVLKVDVTDESTISAAASHCKSRFPATYLRLGFSIPGILHPEKSPSQISYDNALSTYKINTLGPLLLMKHFSPFLPKKITDVASETGLPPYAVWANMSARVGSISDNSLGGWYSYRSSKAAVNQITKSFDIYLKNSSGDKAIAMALHPGTVKTGLSKEFWASTKDEKLFSPEFAAERLVEVVNGVGVEGRGRCWDWEGKEIAP
ncbi:MAG: hypothetical protein M1812_005137 [Candelaria pacifica]|nr:MAG: hypothetical protein M1812_005137 [Candelaria pacifica]